MSEPYDQGRDAAYPQNLRGYTGVVLGYLQAPDALNGWTATEWDWFKDNYKIPIWVGGHQPTSEAWSCLQQLYDLEVPRGKVVLLDMETREDKYYCDTFGHILQWAGFEVWVYGSTSTLFVNPQLNGYAVADPTGVEHMYPHPGVRMTQYAFEQTVDDDAIRHWIMTAGELWK